MLKKCIVSYHTNTWGCGIAKFNEILAQKLNLEVISFHEWINKSEEIFALLSISTKEFTFEDIDELYNKIKNCNFNLFLHSYSENTDQILLKYSLKNFAFNSEIQRELSDKGYKSVEIFTPSLLEDYNIESRVENFKLFTFGMAHKIQMEKAKVLIDVLKKNGMTPEIGISTALHVGEQPLDNLKDYIQNLQEETKTKVYFHGFLSDDSLKKEIINSDLFFRFFDSGVRSNSTSVFAALNLAIPVVTNLDKYSPKYLEHNVNVIDINQLDESVVLNKRELLRLGQAGKLTYCKNSNWERLTETINFHS